MDEYVSDSLINEMKPLEAWWKILKKLKKHLTKRTKKVKLKY